MAFKINRERCELRERAGDQITVELDQASLYDALKRIFATVHTDFSLEPGPGDTQVTIHMHNQPLQVVLQTLLRATPMPLTYRIENGVYTIVKQPRSIPTP